MTSQERIRAIAGMGYLPREAEFLCLAALHSGYFLRRHYGRFLGVGSGGCDSRLVKKLLSRGHARERRLGPRTRLVHLCSHPFYRAIGQPDNRHRRTRSLPAVQVKIMGLDFVLDHLLGQDRDKAELSFLPTEEEKLDCFHRELGIELSRLPQKIYCSPRGGPSTTRCFVDKLPVFRSGSEAFSFAYLDADSVSCSGFETYLEQYRELWARLQSVRILFATGEPFRIPWAERRYRGWLGRRSHSPSELIRFFQLEKLYRERAFDRLPQSALIELRESRQRFAGPRIEELFQRWSTEGEGALRGRSDPLSADRIRFVPHLLKESYDCFKRD